MTTDVTPNAVVAPLKHPVDLRAEGPPVEALAETLVLVPTYNERDSLPLLHKRLRAACPGVGILVIDDNSPDGTGRVADGLADEDPLTWVLHREGKGGLGTAYLQGMEWAVRMGARVVVQMDADGSHQPEQLPVLLDALRRDADVVLGSRYVVGGSTIGWPWYRSVLSRVGNWYARTILRLPVRDATAGFRVFNHRALGSLPFESIRSQGYCFLIEVTLLALRSGLNVVEVPVTFVERKLGASKMSWAVGLETLRRVTSWGLQGRRAPRAARPRPVEPRAAANGQACRLPATSRTNA